MSYRVGCLSGHSLGIDHTNGLDVESESPNGALHVGLDKFMRWYWRVQEMRLTAEIEWRDDIDTPGVETYDFLIKRGGTDEVTDEFMLSADVPTLSGSGPGTSTFPGPTGTGTCTFDPTTGTHNSADHTFGISLAISLGVNVFGFLTRTPLGSPVGSLTFDGESLPLYYFHTSGTFVDSATAALVPTKYYAFKTKSGLPVYDTVSGDQINDPFS